MNTTMNGIFSGWIAQWMGTLLEGIPQWMATLLDSQALFLWWMSVGARWYTSRFNSCAGHGPSWFDALSGYDLETPGLATSAISCRPVSSFHSFGPEEHFMVQSSSLLMTAFSPVSGLHRGRTGAKLAAEASHPERCLALTAGHLHLFQEAI